MSPMTEDSALAAPEATACVRRLWGQFTEYEQHALISFFWHQQKAFMWDQRQRAFLSGMAAGICCGLIPPLLILWRVCT